jgi:carboxyl-terminal processing protease
MVSRFRAAGLALLMLLLGWQLGVGYTQQSYERRLAPGIISGSGGMLADPEKEADLTLLWETWRLLNAHYIEPSALEAPKLIEGAAEGLVHAVGDPYTAYMTPTQDRAFRDGLSGTLQGIGAELVLRDGQVVIVSPLKGSPAEKAGILPEDVIVKVGDEELEGLGLDDVVAKIRGPKGTSVRITLLRQGSMEPIVRTIVREEIHVPSVESKLIERDGKTFGYVALNQFGDETVQEMQRVLQEFRTAKVDGVIVDLRFNGGGYLDAAVDIVSFFQKDGLVVTVQSRKGDPVTHSVKGSPLLPDVPLVVLQNEGSASASEIVAGALQDHRRAEIVGMKSYGKGTVQEIIGLPGGASLRVTVARWLTPGGKNLGKEGVHPDREVARSAEDYQNNRDPQLDAAVNWLLSGKKPGQKASSQASSAQN